MKRLLGYVAALAVTSVAACSPDASAPAATPSQPFTASEPTPAAPAPAPAASSSPSLVGKWAGTITCNKIESPLQMTIDAAKPGEATLSKGEGGALTWTAAVTVSDVARLVSVASSGPADGAERIEGLLGEDGSTITGVMDQQLCTNFALKRQG